MDEFYCSKCSEGMTINDGLMYCSKCSDIFCMDCFISEAGVYCNSCSETLCGKCSGGSMYCSKCSETFCMDCFISKLGLYCNGCSETLCGKCSGGYMYCSKCSETFCMDCFISNLGLNCNGCSETLCGKCSGGYMYCTKCSETFCMDCFVGEGGVYCNGCSEMLCGKCSKGVVVTCEQCSENFCVDCQVEHGIFCSNCSEPVQELDYRFIKFLHKHGAQFDSVDKNNRNALHHAAIEANYSSCLLLISLGLDPATLDSYGSNATDLLHRAINDDEDNSEIPFEEIDLMIEDLREARENFLQRIRDSNWAKNKNFMLAIVGSGIRLTSAEAATHAAEQEAMDKSAAIPDEPRGTKAQNLAYLNRQVLGDDGLVRRVVEFLPIDEAHPRIVPL